MPEESPAIRALPDSSEQSDPLLSDYLRANTESESARQVSILISQHAEPIIRRAIRYKLSLPLDRSDSQHHQDVEDIHSEVVLELISVLRTLRNQPAIRTIHDFRGYTAAISYRACAEYLRKRRPLRASLKNKLRYLLTHCADFALWKNSDDEWVCGLARWRDEAGSKMAARAFFSDSLLDESFARQHRGDALNPRELLAAVFDRAMAPVRIGDLVTLVAEVWGIKDESPEPEDEPLNQIPDLRASFATEIEQRMYLERVWAEIKQLPPRQRRALLLNLTDRMGEGVITLLPAIGVASLREIASTLEMTVEQLAELWNDLPLEDATLAELLGLTRQQVINLRKSARERLARRVRAFAGRA